MATIGFDAGQSIGQLLFGAPVNPLYYGRGLELGAQAQNQMASADLNRKRAVLQAAKNSGVLGMTPEGLVQLNLVPNAAAGAALINAYRANGGDLRGLGTYLSRPGYLQASQQALSNVASGDDQNLNRDLAFLSGHPFDTASDVGHMLINPHGTTAQTPVPDALGTAMIGHVGAQAAQANAAAALAGARTTQVKDAPPKAAALYGKDLTPTAMTPDAIAKHFGRTLGAAKGETLGGLVKGAAQDNVMTLAQALQMQAWLLAQPKGKRNWEWFNDPDSKAPHLNFDPNAFPGANDFPGADSIAPNPNPGLPVQPEPAALVTPASAALPPQGSGALAYSSLPPKTRLAKNPRTGATLALVNNRWVPVDVNR